MLEKKRIRSLVDSKYIKRKNYYVNTKTKSKLERARTSWNGLERDIATKKDNQEFV